MNLKYSLARFSFTGVVALACLAPCVAIGLDFKNARVSIDASTRSFTTNGHETGLMALGLDLHNVFSGAKGDIGTLVFQPYLLRLKNGDSVPPIFEDSDDTSLQWRIANFNYQALPRGRLNVRLGHFELPFGLEQIVQTNGTLYQTNAAAATGLKADWGLSINGTLPRFEYEIASMQGSGNDWDYEGRNLWVGRIGTPRDHAWWIGLSALKGKTLNAGSGLNNNARRAGLDVGIRLAHGFSWLIESTVGKDNSVSVAHYFTEVNWRSPQEHWFAYLQGNASAFAREHGKSNTRGATLGLRYEPNAKISLSLETKHQLNRPNSTRRLHRTAVQFRYRL